MDAPPGRTRYDRPRARAAVPLHLVGLGLHDVRDITVKGLERVRGADRVYAEFYTAMLAGTGHDELCTFLEKEVHVLPREGVETGRLIEEARDQVVVLLTAGDPLTATTHTDLMLRCRASGVPFRVVHAPSIYAAAPGLLGLQHYKFGRTTTLVRPAQGWSPTSPFKAVQQNHDADLHTLVLLDIQAHEGYYMRADEGLRSLLDMARRLDAGWFDADAEVGVVARAGAPEPHVVTGPAGALAAMDHGDPLHCIVVPGGLHEVEAEAWRSLAHA